MLARQLTTNNPQLPDSLVEFDYVKGEFLPIVPTTQIVVVFESKGTQIHKETEEAKHQVIEQGLDRKKVSLIHTILIKKFQLPYCSRTLTAYFQMKKALAGLKRLQMS